MKLDKVNPAEIVDELAAVKARQADLEGEADGYKAVLITLAAMNRGTTFDGTQHRATVSFVDKRVIDWHSVARRLAAAAGYTNGRFERLQDEHTKTVSGMPIVRVTARS